MFWVAVVVVGILAIVALVVVIGLLLPKQHRAVRNKSFSCSPEPVWNAITDFSNTSGWRKQLKSVEALPARNGHPVWKEIDRSGDAIAYETLELVYPRRLVRKIADDKLPFGGTWTIEIKPEPGGTVVEIVEDGIVFNPIFRFVSKFILGHTRTIDNYLAELSQHLEASRAPASSRAPTPVR
jgi:hypothetical protein